jgi:hypothetical protein
LLRFVACKFNENIELSDAVLIGIEMLGSSAPKINVDRLTVRGSARIRAQPGPDPNAAPRLGMVRSCGADVRGNLDMRGCVLGVEHDRQNSLTLFADGLHVQGSVLLSDGLN